MMLRLKAPKAPKQKEKERERINAIQIIYFPLSGRTIDDDADILYYHIRIHFVILYCVSLFAALVFLYLD